MKKFNTPILLIAFNRPEVTQQVFNIIREIRPAFFYVAMDAPRVGRPADEDQCRRTKEILNQIDWDCELKTLFHNCNQGCAKGPSSAITWFFEQVEQGIILEDDIVPHPDFFFYCEELLERYKVDERVAVITGINHKDGRVFGEASYFFSCQPHTWGWATWRRVWQGYDLFLENYSAEEFREALKWCGFNWNDRRMQWDRFKIMKKQGTDGWDWQFMFHVWRKRGLTIIPNINMIRNIGFGGDATHFKGSGGKLEQMTVHSILPLKHPDKIERDLQADSETSSFVKVYIPVVNAPLTIRKSALWWIWRCFRRNFLINSKFSK